MNEHDATELAFKNGYKKAVTEILDKIECCIILRERQHRPFGAYDYVKYYDAELERDIANLKKKYTEDRQMPTVDVVGVTRCKDCKYFISEICRLDFGLNFCRGDDYCCYGERKK